MFRIVEDDMPPFPEGCSELLKDFLCQCFNKDPSKRPSAEALCEHEWLKFTWVAGQERRQQDSIPDLRRVGPAGLLDAAEFLELKTQKQYSTLNSEEESWDDEPSIMVDPNLQLVGLISVSLLSLGDSTAS
jgi:serine/threonine protein kinase